MVKKYDVAYKRVVITANATWEAIITVTEETGMGTKTTIFTFHGDSKEEAKKEAMSFMMDAFSK